MGVARWEPRTEADIASMIADGTLQEGHYFDAKREIGDTPSNRKETTRDLASFSIDGGTLVVGIDEDRTTGTFRLHPVPLTGQPERLEQVARSLADPPLDVRTAVIPTAADPATGFLVVHIPVSPLAPHMVDGRYWGRNDRTKYALSDADVQRLVERRQGWASSADRWLIEEIGRDPLPDGERPHLFVVAQPVAAGSEALVSLLAHEGCESGLRAFRLQAMTASIGEATAAIAASRGLPGGGWHPDLDKANNLDRRPHGMALTVYQLRDGRQYSPSRLGDDEHTLIDIEFREDAGLRLYCARAGDIWGHDRYPEPIRVAMDVIIAGLVRRSLALAVAIAASIDYYGPWDLGAAVTGLNGVRSFALLNRNHFPEGVTPYGAEQFKATTRASREELEARPGAVTQRLLGRLFRSFGSAGLIAPLLTDAEG
jgi:hypothetical protein